MNPAPLQFIFLILSPRAAVWFPEITSNQELDLILLPEVMVPSCELIFQATLMLFANLESCVSMAK